MPQNKQMKIQWVTIDGRNTPFVLPQIWDETIQDWVVTSDVNPLPTSDDQLLQKINDLNNKVDGIIDGTTPVPTQLTGSKVEDIINNQTEMLNIQTEIKNRMGGKVTDHTNSPGSKVLQMGDTDAGFYGFVQPHEFGQIGSNEFNGVNLASAVGISQGTAQFSETPWMKFSWRGKILFVPLKAVRYSVSWDHIYQAGAVYGTGSTISAGEQFMLDNDENYGESARVSQNARVTIGGIEYIVRLMKGAGSDPTDSYSDNDRGSSGVNNEWNNLILPLHANAPSSFNYNQYADTPRPDWGIGLTDEILRTHNRYGTGSYTWCQETRDTIEGSEDGTVRRVLRGYYGASFLLAGASWGTHTNGAWRPVLKLA